MTVVRARGLALQVHEEMRRRIAAGEFPPGTAVVIADIAKQLGVSATPVREAFSRLAAEGQLRFVDNFGYSVPRCRWRRTMWTGPLRAWSWRPMHCSMSRTPGQGRA